VEQEYSWNNLEVKNSYDTLSSFPSFEQPFTMSENPVILEQPVNIVDESHVEQLEDIPLLQEPRLLQESSTPPEYKLSKKAKRERFRMISELIINHLTLSPVTTRSLLESLQDSYPTLTMTEMDSMLYQLLIRSMVRREGKRIPYMWSLSPNKN